MLTLITEKARIEAEIRAAEAATRMRAENELKQQRERKREEARMAVEKVYLCFKVFTGSCMNVVSFFAFVV